MRQLLAQTFSGAHPIYRILTAHSAVCRRSEKIAIAYFIYTAFLITAHGSTPARCLAAWTIPLAVWFAIGIETRHSTGWSRVLRDWAALGLLLIAYWQVDWVAIKPPYLNWQRAWLGWDRTLLDSLRLRAAIEYFGGVIPAGLEAVYLSLYAIPALCLGALYWYGRRNQIDRFMSTLFLGTLCAYALLPVLPVSGPRIAFANLDLPHYSSPLRWLNGWLLDRCDVSSSVFPSGHVAVAFACAFGVVRTLSDRRLFCALILTAAALVYVATIYCRYHYAVDGLASIAITFAAWRTTEAMDRNA